MTTTELLAPVGARFELVGHDCPLGEYPAVLVPIGELSGRTVMVYTGGGDTEYRLVAPKARFSRHNESVARTLQNFDPRKHGLFGINANDVLTYELGKEQGFYAHLLRSSVAFSIEPFYRLSLAIETEDLVLITDLYRRCLRQLQRHCPELVVPLIKSIPAPTAVVAHIQREMLREAEEPLPHSTSTGLWLQAAAARSVSTVADRDYPRVAAGRTMGAESIQAAVRSLLRQEPFRITTWGEVYALALRTSLGAWGAPKPEGEAIPSARDVAETSTLSLSHLEFRNILLSKATAIEFLNRSRSGLSVEVLSRDVLTAGSYKHRFGHAPTKVRQRPVFTYAEVLSLVQYAGTVAPV